MFLVVLLFGMALLLGTQEKDVDIFLGGEQGCIFPNSSPRAYLQKATSLTHSKLKKQTPLLIQKFKRFCPHDKDCENSLHFVWPTSNILLALPVNSIIFKYKIWIILDFFW